MEKIYIGISSRILTDSFERLNVTTTYLNLVKKSNYIPIILPIDLSDEILEELLNICNRFIITGGNDINPKRYYDILNIHTSFDNRVDDLDFKIIDYAISHNKPLLGICRGLQVINVYFNGTLNQHLPTVSLLSHYDSTHYIKPINNEKVNINWLNKDYLIKSYHHQAINILGDNLLPLFVSDDDYIESLIHNTLPIIATQWHIEQDLESELTSKIWNYFESM